MVWPNLNAEDAKMLDTVASALGLYLHVIG